MVARRNWQGTQCNIFLQCFSVTQVGPEVNRPIDGAGFTNGLKRP